MFSLSVDAWLRRVRDAAMDSAWPARCVLCGFPGQFPARDLCAGCEAELPFNRQRCSICALPLASDGEGLICGACVQRRPRFDVCCAPLRYAYPVDHMVRRLKYSDSLAEGRVLAELFARSLANCRERSLPEVILPVPLGRARFRQRGYNQAIELARHLRRLTGVGIDTTSLLRTRDTLEQAGLDRAARRRNLRRAFALAQPLRARHVAILDDVVTTMSTVNELARVLRRGGVQTIEVWAIARAG